jgi:hypothetical protein
MAPSDPAQLSTENLWALKLWFDENFKERGHAVDVRAFVSVFILE